MPVIVEDNPNYLLRDCLPDEDLQDPRFGCPYVAYMVANREHFAGYGNTPDEAIANLQKLVNEHASKYLRGIGLVSESEPGTDYPGV